MLAARRRSLALTLGTIYALLALLLLLAFVAADRVDRPTSVFLRDPMGVFDGPGYIGALSNVGVLGWAAGAYAAGLAWLVLGGGRRSPYLWGGLLTGVLLADDFFLLHESYYPSVGVSSAIAAVFYAGATVTYLVVFRDFIRRHDAVLMPPALVLFGLSAVIDHSSEREWALVLEDVFKLFGIFTWSLFFVRAALSDLRARSR